MIIMKYYNKTNNDYRIYYKNDDYIYYKKFNNDRYDYYRVNDFSLFYNLIGKQDNYINYYINHGIDNILYIDKELEEFIDYKLYNKKEKLEFNNPKYNMQLFNNYKEGKLTSKKDLELIAKKSKEKRFYFKTALGLITLIASFDFFSELQLRKDLNNALKDDYYTSLLIDNKKEEDINSIIMNLDCLTESQKIRIISSGLIEDVSKYYNEEEYLECLDNLKHLELVYFKPQKDNLGLSGYVSSDHPSQINLKEDDSLTAKYTLYHEFIHILQQPIYPKKNNIYLNEGMAELLSKEYLDTEIVTYKKDVRNIKLLVCTIGYKPLFKGNFYNGNDNIDDIINFYLEEEDSNKLLNYFNESACSLTDDDKDEIMLLIEKLYKNMYGVDMKDNVVGYDIIVNPDNYLYVEDNRKYLKEGKVEQEGLVKITLPDTESINNLRYNEVVNINSYELYSRTIDNLKEYETLKNEDFVEYTTLAYNKTKIQDGKLSQIDNSRFTNSKNFVYELNGESIFLTEEEALKEGYIYYRAYAKKDNLNQISGWKLYKKINEYTLKFPSVLENVKSLEQFEDVKAK